MSNIYRKRRYIAIILASFVALLSIITSENIFVEKKIDNSDQLADSGQVLSMEDSQLALSVLEEIEIKGRAPKTDYSRDKFGSGWLTSNGCDTRNIILNRDLNDVQINESCAVISGYLNDPYSGKEISFKRGSETSADIQIDHVVALGDAWQKGAQLLEKENRITFANDPLELLAVSAETNQNKGDSDAASWLPPNKAFRCQYVARQIAIKQKYNLWMTSAEKETIKAVLLKCPNQLLPKA